LTSASAACCGVSKSLAPADDAAGVLFAVDRWAEKRNDAGTHAHTTTHKMEICFQDFVFVSIDFISVLL
jgi:hypothetical protein